MIYLLAKIIWGGSASNKSLESNIFTLRISREKNSQKSQCTPPARSPFDTASLMPRGCVEASTGQQRRREGGWWTSHVGPHWDSNNNNSVITLQGRVRKCMDTNMLNSLSGQLVMIILLLANHKSELRLDQRPSPGSGFKKDFWSDIRFSNRPRPLLPHFNFIQNHFSMTHWRAP